MPRLEYVPIGSPHQELLDSEEFARNRQQLGALEEELADRRREVEAGWGQKYVDRCHADGKLTAWERIQILVDPGGEIMPIGTFVNYGQRFGERQLLCPGAGVITAFVRVQGRIVVVIANDNTVASGAWWPRTPEKIERAQEIARRLRLPVVYLVDCSGLFLPEQARSFPGWTGAGHIFQKNALLSAHGVPQIAAVFGDCIAGGGYMPIISDRVIMTENAYMVIAAAALIKGAKAQHITSHDIGGPEVHVHASACADLRVPDDRSALAWIRQEVSRLPTTAADYYRGEAAPAPPRFSPQELPGLLPADAARAYDMREVLARLVDASHFAELLTDRGLEVVTGVARLGGLPVGIIANAVSLFPHPSQPDQMRSGSILYREGIAKVSQFSRACDSDGIPILWMQDISGFDIGAEAEREGLLGYGSNLIYTNSTNTTPMVTILLRKASGAGYYAMAGLPYEPVLQLSTPLSRLAVMDGRTAAIASYNSKLDSSFEIPEGTPPEDAEKIRAGMEAVEQKLRADMDPIRSASQMDSDEVIPLTSLREWMVLAAEVCYQTIGYRRIKNPRIWSLHDLDVLTEP